MSKDPSTQRKTVPNMMPEILRLAYQRRILPSVTEIDHPDLTDNNWPKSQEAVAIEKAHEAHLAKVQAITNKLRNAPTNGLKEGAEVRITEKDINGKQTYVDYKYANGALVHPEQETWGNSIFTNTAADTAKTTVKTTSAVTFLGLLTERNANTHKRKPVDELAGETAKKPRTTPPPFSAEHAAPMAQVATLRPAAQQPSQPLSPTRYYPACEADSGVYANNRIQCRAPLGDISLSASNPSPVNPAPAGPSNSYSSSSSNTIANSPTSSPHSGDNGCSSPWASPLGPKSRTAAVRTRSSGVA